jgi:hypothetical protein
VKSAIAVLTCAARGAYLEQTIASLERAGAGELDRVIYVDGPAEPLEGRFPGWFVASVSDEPGRGARLAMVEIMRRASAAGVELLLYFEDDVVLCRNAIRAMIEIGVPEPLGFVSYCDLRGGGPPLELHALPGQFRGYGLPEGGFRGCQALAIPLRTLRVFDTWEAPPWVDRNMCDETIAQVVPAFGVFDSLADHTGHVSAITGRAYPAGRELRAAGFPGEDFDADAVPRAFELNEIGRRCPKCVGVLHPDRRPCAGATAEHERMIS